MPPGSLSSSHGADWQQFTFAPGPSCTGCEIIGKFSDVTIITTGELIGTALSRTAKPAITASYLVFSQFATNSEYFSKGSCLTTSGPFVSLVPAYSVTKPSGSSIDSAQFSENAQREFIEFLGAGTCTGHGQEVVTEQITPVDGQTIASISLSRTGNITTESRSHTSSPSLVISSVSVLPSNILTGFSSPALPSKQPSHIDSAPSSLSPRVKISIGVVIPILSTVLIILGIHFLRKYRALRRSIAAREEISHQNDASWEKPELHGDSCRHEMLDEHRRQEAEAGQMRHEMPGDEVPENYPRQEVEEARRQNLAAQRRQELRGTDMTYELEVPRGF